MIKDRTYEKNMDEAAKAGVARGVYWILPGDYHGRSGNRGEGSVQVCRGQKAELPMPMDMEFSNGRLDAAYAGWVSEGGSANARKQLTLIADAFLNYCRDHGYTTCLYVSQSLTSKTSGVDVAKLVKDGHELWIAQQWPTLASSKVPYWQYSSIDRISGIRGRVDSNYMYIPKNKNTNGNKKMEATMDYEQLAYTGNPVEPEVTVQDGVTKLTENQDYTLVYAKNIRKGTGYVIVKGKGKYRDMECVPFRIGSKTIEKEERANEVTDVVTSEVNGKTVQARVHRSGERHGITTEYSTGIQR